MGRVTVLVIAALMPALSARANDFEVRLGFTNAHLRELFFGCNDKGKDGYDRGLDDFAPPPGIAVGYVGFVPPAKLPFFYKDIRGPKGPHQWKLYIKVHKDKPIVISWDRKSLPKGWIFTLTQEKTTIRLHEKTELVVNASGTLTLTGERKTAADDGATPPTPDKRK